MKRKHVLPLLSLVAAAGAAGAFFLLYEPTMKEALTADPRTASPLVRVAEATTTGTAERSFTGTVASRVQSNLGFRVPGKIVERMVDVGQQVKQGQALMRIDETDLQLALTAKRNAVTAARAVLIQAQADEKRGVRGARMQDTECFGQKNREQQQAEDEHAVQRRRARMP